MKNKLNEAFDNIDLKYAEATENPPKKNKALKFVLIAAAIALTVAAVPVITVMSRHGAAEAAPPGVSRGGLSGEPAGNNGLDGESTDNSSGGLSYGADTLPMGEKAPSEPFAGKTGDYSGAKFKSVADTKITAADVYRGASYSDNLKKYRADGEILDGFFDKLTQKLLDGEKSGVVSPVNIYMALSLLAECTDGNSRKEILDVLGVETVEQLREQSKRIWLYNSRDDEYGRSVMGNSIWTTYGNPVKEPCVGILKDDHYASVFCGDFGDEKYVLAFKQWLSDMTNGLLDDCINDIPISEDASTVLASTLYYKTSWQDAFYDKYSGTFNGQSGKTNCEFNKKKKAALIYAGSGFTAFCDELSDGNNMWFFLPDEDKTVSDILKTDLVNYINDLTFADGKYYEVTVSMPDFDVTYNDSILEKLKELGIKECTTGKADFSPLLDGQHYLAQVIHAARFMADKDGVEGAALTVMEIDRGVVVEEQKYDFTLDRPFVFMVENGGVPLFVGCVNDLQ